MTTEGWSWPSNARKMHYYRDGRSLCRRYQFVAPMNTPLVDDPRDPRGRFLCAACQKRLAK